MYATPLVCEVPTQARPCGAAHLSAEGQGNGASDGGEDDVQVEAVDGIVHGLEAGAVDCEPEGSLAATEDTEGGTGGSTTAQQTGRTTTGTHTRN